MPALTDALPLIERDSLTEGDRFGGPTHFILGGKSRYVLPTDEEKIRRHFPHATLTSLPDAGHNPHMESREQFVKTFLELAGSKTP